jgi:hypothetical protein
VPIFRAVAVHGVQIAPRTDRVHRWSVPSTNRPCGTPQSPKSLPTTAKPCGQGTPTESLYGSLKMRRNLPRLGIPVPRRTLNGSSATAGTAPQVLAARRVAQSATRLRPKRIQPGRCPAN